MLTPSDVNPSPPHMGEVHTYKGMVSTRVGLMRNEVAGQSEGPIGTLKIGVKSANELETF